MQLDITKKKETVNLSTGCYNEMCERQIDDDMKEDKDTSRLGTGRPKTIGYIM